VIPPLPPLAAVETAPRHDLGKADAACRPGEAGPALVVEVAGLRDRRGLLKLEAYPPDDQGFLADDATLVATGRAFRRLELPPAAEGSVELCIRVPRPGTYAFSLLHDRNANHRFDVAIDGVGFSRNPRLGWTKPKAADVIMEVGQRPAITRIVINYRHGLSMRPDAR
jgi:uncharacterized protein (DUF2141 family)